MRTVPSVLKALLITAVLPAAATACMLNLSSGTEKPAAGGTGTVTAQFIQSHRNCTIQPEETLFETQGVEILSTSAWEPVRNGVYECTLDVRFAQAGPALIKAVRTCPKGGMTRELEWDVLP